MDRDEMLEIKMQGYTVFLTRGELNLLLKSNPNIWKQSIKRGKYILRSRKQKEREAKMIRVTG